MTAPELPEELRALEAEIENREVPGLPPELRNRVMKSVESEFCQEAPRTNDQTLWWFLGAAAAVMLMWISMAMTGVNSLSWSSESGMNAQSIKTTADRLMKEVPGFTRAGARRSTLLMHAASRLRTR